MQQNVIFLRNPHAGTIMRSPTGKPVALTGTPVGRSPEQERPGKAGALASKDRNFRLRPPYFISVKRTRARLFLFLGIRLIFLPTELTPRRRYNPIADFKADVSMVRRKNDEG